jgi:uncharacterized membrane protein YgdD (TMEM256/DUF423 family)
MTPVRSISTGALFAFLGVCLGAFAAHGLKLEGYEAQVFETAVRYQFYHALALILVGTISLQRPNLLQGAIPILFTVGIIIFSGSLYAIVFTGIKIFGAITPIGGVCFLIAWLMMLIRTCRSDS